MNELNRIYNVNDNFLDVIDSPNKAYLVGLWYADGTVYDKTNHIKIDLIDKELLVKLKKMLGYKGNILEYKDEFKVFNGKKYPCQTSYRLNICSKRLVQRMIDLGCVPNKTYILKFPTENQIPKEFIKDFIRGYMDGDGGISYWIPETKTTTNWKKFQIHFCGTTEIINGISQILSDKFNCKPSKSSRYPDKNNNNMQMNICGNKVVRNILDWLYFDAEIYMDRKYNKYLELIKEGQRITDTKDILYGSAHERRKVIDLQTLKVYNSLKEASDAFNLSGASVIFNRCKKHQGVMYLDEYEKEMKENGFVIKNEIYKIKKQTIEEGIEKNGIRQADKFI